MTIKVGINGFGRIGRNVLRSAVQNFAGEIEIVAINDLLEPDYLAYMLSYDSVHGRFKGDVKVEGNTLIINGKKIRLTQERDPANLKWDEVGADVVPLEVGRVAFLRQADLLAVDDQRAAFDLHVALEAAVHRVVLQHVGQVIRLQQIVDRDDLDVAEVLHGGAQHVAADAAEAIDTNLDRHGGS